MSSSDHLWQTRSERENSPEDQVCIREVLEAAFETNTEANLVDVPA